MKTVRLMIVDDDELVFFLTSRMIAALHLPTEVISCTDGLEAITYFKNNVNNADELPDVVFLDLSMPIMDGWEFLDEYSVLRSGIAKQNNLYVLSSSVSPHDVERSKQYSFVVDFCVKPLSKDLIHKILTELIAQQ